MAGGMPGMHAFAACLSGKVICGALICFPSADTLYQIPFPREKVNHHHMFAKEYYMYLLLSLHRHCIPVNFPHVQKIPRHLICQDHPHIMHDAFSAKY